MPALIPKLDGHQVDVAGFCLYTRDARLEYGGRQKVCFPIGNINSGDQPSVFEISLLTQ
jgi:hypothetical protein